jgi:hypothetical protein
MNALLSGVDLVGAMLSLSQSREALPQPESRLGIRTRQLLLAVLGCTARRVSHRDRC